MSMARQIPVALGVGSLFLVLSRAQHKVDFQSDIQPIFEKSCGQCHSVKAQMGQLRLDSVAAAMAGGQSGKVIVPGHASDSILYQRVAGLSDQARMPMGGKLSVDQIEKIRTWIDQGAEWPPISTSTAPTKKHWAFVAPVRPVTPKVNQAKWVSNPVDAFILARLETEKLAPSPQPDRTTLLRRLSLDLIDVPPPPEEINAFLTTPTPNPNSTQS